MTKLASSFCEDRGRPGESQAEPGVVVREIVEFLGVSRCQVQINCGYGKQMVRVNVKW